MWWPDSSNSGKRQQDKWNIANIKEQNPGPLLSLYLYNDISKAMTVYRASLKLQKATLITTNKYVAW